MLCGRRDAIHSENVDIHMDGYSQESCVFLLLSSVVSLPDKILLCKYPILKMIFM